MARWEGTTESRFWAKVDETAVRRLDLGECWEWTGRRNPKGYGVTSAGGRLWYAHRFSWAMCVGDIPADTCVLHHCDNPPCVRPSHLWLGTRADNNRDMAQKGRSSGGARVPLRGERHPFAKLNKARVRYVYRIRARGLSIEKIAHRLGVNYRTVRDILVGITWTHIPPP